MIRINTSNERLHERPIGKHVKVPDAMSDGTRESLCEDVATTAGPPRCLCPPHADQCRRPARTRRDGPFTGNGWEQPGRVRGPPGRNANRSSEESERLAKS